MRIGIFGGTFDPIHNGHVRAAQAFLRHASLDKLYVIPDKTPPHKAIGEGDDPEIRFRMTKLAFEHDPIFSDRIVVSDMELKREEPSFTYLTIRAFREMGFSDLYLYCGTDMFLTLHEWKNASEFLPLCTVAYAGREWQDETLRNAVSKQKAFLSEHCRARILEIPLDPITISSREIRKMLACGEDVSHAIPPSVYEFIREKGLYQ